MKPIRFLIICSLLGLCGCGVLIDSIAAPFYSKALTKKDSKKSNSENKQLEEDN